jgi:hypothetical protein
MVESSAYAVASRSTGSGVELFGLLNQDAGDIGVDTPVAFAVGICQGALGRCTPNAHVKEHRFDRLQTGDQISQAFAVG